MPRRGNLIGRDQLAAGGKDRHARRFDYRDRGAADLGKQTDFQGPQHSTGNQHRLPAVQVRRPPEDVLAKAKPIVLDSNAFEAQLEAPPAAGSTSVVSSCITTASAADGRGRRS